MGSGNQTLLLVNNLDNMTLTIWHIVEFLIPAFGFALIVYGLIVFAKEQSKPAMQQGSSWIKFFIAGILFFNLPAVLGIAGETVFGFMGTDIVKGSADLAYASGSQGSKGQDAVFSFVLHVVQLTGLIGMVKAIMIINDPQGKSSDAIKIAFGATLALNISKLLVFLANNIGGAIGDAINKVI